MECYKFSCTISYWNEAGTKLFPKLITFPLFLCQIFLYVCLCCGALPSLSRLSVAGRPVKAERERRETEPLPDSRPTPVVPEYKEREKMKAEKEIYHYYRILLKFKSFFTSDYCVAFNFLHNLLSPLSSFFILRPSSAERGARSGRRGRGGLRAQNVCVCCSLATLLKDMH